MTKETLRRVIVSELYRQNQADDGHLYLYGHYDIGDHRILRTAELEEIGVDGHLSIDKLADAIMIVLKEVKNE